MNKWWFKVTRLIPDATGTTCNQRLERIGGTEHTNILRVPFRNENGILRKWISRFDVWPYLETFAEVGIKQCYICFFLLFVSIPSNWCCQIRASITYLRCRRILGFEFYYIVEVWMPLNYWICNKSWACKS